MTEDDLGLLSAISRCDWPKREWSLDAYLRCAIEVALAKYYSVCRDRCVAAETLHRAVFQAINRVTDPMLAWDVKRAFPLCQEGSVPLYPLLHAAYRNGYEQRMPVWYDYEICSYVFDPGKPDVTVAQMCWVDRPRLARWRLPARLAQQFAELLCEELLALRQREMLVPVVI